MPLFGACDGGTCGGSTYGGYYGGGNTKVSEVVGVVVVLVLTFMLWFSVGLSDQGKNECALVLNSGLITIGGVAAIAMALLMYKERSN